MTTPHSPTLLESDPQSSETSLENNDLGKELLEAARLGDTNRVSNLMSNGAPLTNDWLGTTPLHLASIYGHTAVVEILIKSGISRDGRNKVDKAPLHFACQHGHFEIVKLLVDNGANVNSMDMLKMTPLHWAVEANNYEICLLLLKFGVKTTLQNKFGKTALQIAKEKSLLSIVDLLNIKEINVSASSYKRLDDFGTTFHCGNATSTSSSSHTTNSIVKNSDLPTDQIAHSIYLPSSNIHIPLKMPSEIAALSKDSFNPNILHSGIPVITSLALSMLPPSIQAIPLSIGSSYSNQETTIPISLSDTSKVFCTKICCSPVSQVFTTSSPQTVSHPITSCNTQVNSCAQNPIPTVQPPNFLQEPTVPINIPFSLLTQIIDSGVKLYARQSISDVATGFVGIDTPMGTIPILPSSMEDGLQLIAVGNESNMASSLHFPCSQTSTTVDPIHQTGHNSVPLCFHSHGLAQYPVGAAGVNLISTHNGGLDFPNCILENKGTNEGGFQLIAVGNERGTIPSNSLYYSQPSTSNIPLQQVVPNQPSPLFFHSHSMNSHPMRHPGLFSVQNGGFHFSNGFFDQKSVVAQSSPMFLSNGLCVQPYIKQYCHPLLPPLQSLDLTSHNHIRPIYVPVNSNPLVHQSSLFPYYGQPILMPPIQSSAEILQQAPITSTEHSPTVYKSSVSKGTITENMLTPEPDSST